MATLPTSASNTLMPPGRTRLLRPTRDRKDGPSTLTPTVRFLDHLCSSAALPGWTSAANLHQLMARSKPRWNPRPDAATTQMHSCILTEDNCVHPNSRKYSRSRAAAAPNTRSRVAPHLSVEGSTLETLSSQG